MPKSFASSRSAPRRLVSAPILAALSLAAAGCGGAKDINSTPASVQAAFARAGVALVNPQQVLPADSLAPPARSARAPARPLTALLDGLRNVALAPNVNPGGRPAALRGQWLLVLVYPRPEGAQGKAKSYADLAGAEAILHTTDFGYALKGNVVVDYRVYSTNDRIPGYLGQWQTVGELNHRLKSQVVAALARLP